MALPKHGWWRGCSSTWGNTAETWGQGGKCQAQRKGGTQWCTSRGTQWSRRSNDAASFGSSWAKEKRDGRIETKGGWIWRWSEERLPVKVSGTAAREWWVLIAVPWNKYQTLRQCLHVFTTFSHRQQKPRIKKEKRRRWRSRSRKMWKRLQMFATSCIHTPCDVNVCRFLSSRALVPKRPLASRHCVQCAIHSLLHCSIERFHSLSRMSSASASVWLAERFVQGSIVCFGLMVSEVQDAKRMNLQMPEAGASIEATAPFPVQPCNRFSKPCKEWKNSSRIRQLPLIHCLYLPFILAHQEQALVAAISLNWSNIFSRSHQSWNFASLGWHLSWWLLCNPARNCWRPQESQTVCCWNVDSIINHCKALSHRFDIVLQIR